jgi:hypothetical protein
VIEAIGVVVPAHDEESTIASCLASILVACAHPAVRGVPIRVTTALDHCSDDTGEVTMRMAAAAPHRVRPAVEVATVELRATNVGKARAAGCDDVLRAFAGLDAHRVWLATTDADSVVPSDWLAHHLSLHRHGADGCTGTVCVRHWDEQPARVASSFPRWYLPPGSGHHDHVHGANLGFTADAYRRAGGFAAMSCSEDRALSHAMRSRGARIVPTLGAPVMTSARREGRVTGGFSDFLRRSGEVSQSAQTATIPDRRM